MASFALAPCSAKLACRASLRTRNVAQRLPARAARRAQLAAPRSAISLPPPTADEQSPAQWLQATLQALLAPAAAVEESAARPASDAPAEEDAAAPAEEPEFDDALIW